MAKKKGNCKPGSKARVTKKVKNGQSKKKQTATRKSPGQRQRVRKAPAQNSEPAPVPVKKRRKKPVKRPARLFKQEHIAEFEASSIPIGLMRRAGIRSVTPQEARKLTGHSCSSGWAVPFPDLKGGPPTWLIKPDVPHVDASGKTIKYLWPRGKSNRVYFPPGIEPILLDTSIPLIPTEGVKKAL